ncbi:SDR family oxidoreductase [Nonomuraea sp. NPDC049141]|uniref:SDR family oxidoreductase n=1 Tax=unclassified Nonomuraea TaxID=2593643 RepID=UPI0033E42609
MSLIGKRIVLVGGTSGIGLATAEAAAREGAQVVVASRRRASVDGALARLPEDAEGHVLDVTSEEQVRDVFHRIGAFDHLVFTAGETLLVEELAVASVERARRFLDIRLWGAYTAVKYGSPAIREGGSIVLTTGVAGRRPHKGFTAAASLCGAMEALTRALAVELAPIRVNVVSPGVVRTDLWSDMPEADRDAMYKAMAETLPAGRVGEPDDIAETYLYLMRGGFSTGSVVIVDGGTVLV